MNIKKIAFQSVVVGLCQYEVLAITTRQFPTLTSISRKHRWLPFVIVGGLAGHLYRQRLAEIFFVRLLSQTRYFLAHPHRLTALVAGRKGVVLEVHFLVAPDASRRMNLIDMG
jgi:hypothetical protein